MVDHQKSIVRFFPGFLPDYLRDTTTLADSLRRAFEHWWTVKRALVECDVWLVSSERLKAAFRACLPAVVEVVPSEAVIPISKLASGADFRTAIVDSVANW